MGRRKIEIAPIHVGLCYVRFKFVIFPLISRRLAFETDTNAPTVAHNDKVLAITFLYILTASQDGAPQDRNRADTCQCALRARARVSTIPASWLS